jgi:HPt (histidine-containing phosphotransfer) domain-containing protein
LKRTNGKASLYRSVLEAFARTQARTVERLDTAIELRDEKDAVLAVHTTKGAAANIGAETLREAAATLESALRKGMGEVRPEMVVDFQRELKRVLISLANAGFSTTSPAMEADRGIPENMVPVVDVATLAPLLDNLEKLLADGSVDSVGAVEQLGRYLMNSKAADAFSRLRKETANFDTDAALIDLNRIRDELAI